MSEGSEAARTRDKYINEIVSWLDCGNRSWVDDNRQIDVEHGGSAMDVAMFATRRLLGKIHALPEEVFFSGALIREVA